MPERTSNDEPEWSPEVLQLAAEEAASSGHSKILPAHLLIALCRFVDVARNNLSTDIQATQRRLRRELEGFSIDPQRFRRRLRALIVKNTVGDAVGTLQHELAQYAAKQGQRPGLASATACAEATRAVMKQAATLAGAEEDNDGLYLLRALLLGDMEVALAPALNKPSPDKLPDRL